MSNEEKIEAETKKLIARLAAKFGGKVSPKLAQSARDAVRQRINDPKAFNNT